MLLEKIQSNDELLRLTHQPNELQREVNDAKAKLYQKMKEKKNKICNNDNDHEGNITVQNNLSSNHNKNANNNNGNNNGNNYRNNTRSNHHIANSQQIQNDSAHLSPNIHYNQDCSTNNNQSNTYNNNRNIVHNLDNNRNIHRNNNNMNNNNDPLHRINIEDKYALYNNNINKQYCYHQYQKSMRSYSQKGREENHGLYWRYKTQICRTPGCIRGIGCSFAHPEENEVPRCVHWARNRYCDLADKCFFVHQTPIDYEIDIVKKLLHHLCSVRANGNTNK